MLVPWEASCCSLKKWRRGNWLVVSLEKFSAAFSSVFNSLASQMLTLRSLSLAKRLIVLSNTFEPDFWATTLTWGDPPQQWAGEYCECGRVTVGEGQGMLAPTPFWKRKLFFMKPKKQKGSNKNLNRSPASAVVLKSKHKEIFLKKGCSCES